MYLPQGTELNHRYVIESLLGHGGFGITYAARDTTLNVRVAIKEYLPRQLATRGEGQTKVSIFTGEARQQYDYGLRKFLEEAQSVARFAHHPNVVSARDYFEANGTAYMVMEYVEGVTLKEYLAKKGGRISFEEARGIMMPVMDALREVHQAGMLHRDVSPDNIYITTSAQVKILDFGAARYFAGEQSKSLSIILKVGYAPVEQYSSKGKQGPWTDIYATAATLYKAITGETPPDALDRLTEDTLAPPSRLGVSISPPAERALIRALEVNAGQRFQNMGEFQQALLGEAGVTRGFQPASAPFRTAPDPSYTPVSGLGSAPPPISGQPAAPPSHQPSHYPQAARRSANPAAIAAGIGAGVLGLALLVVLIWRLTSGPSPTAVVKPPAGGGQKTDTFTSGPPLVQAPTPPLKEPPPQSELVFVRNGNVWIATSDGTNARQLTFTGQASKPVLSRDGSLVAFLGPGQNKHRKKIFLISSQGGNIRALNLPNISSSDGLNFSPDGKHLLFRGWFFGGGEDNNTVSILMVNCQNFSLRKILSKGSLLDDEADIMAHPAFSPDGNLIVYQKSDHMSISGFVIIDLTGKEISSFNGHDEEMPSYLEPSFSPDGQEILCYSYQFKATAKEDHNIIYLVNWRTGAKRKLARGSNPTFVDGGKAIVFEDNIPGPKRLYRLDLAPGAQPRLILRNADSPAGQS